MKTFYLEAGINHFGNVNEANLILKYFLKSKFHNLTFMLHTEKFYFKYSNQIFDEKNRYCCHIGTNIS